MSFGAHTASMADAALVHAVISNAGGLAECTSVYLDAQIQNGLDPVPSTVASSTAFNFTAEPAFDWCTNALRQSEYCADLHSSKIMRSSFRERRLGRGNLSGK